MMLTMPFSSPPCENAWRTCRTLMFRGMSQLLVSCIPQSEHQHVPELPRTIAITRLMLVPHLFHERLRKIWILFLYQMSAREIANAIAEPVRHRYCKSHFVAMD